MDFKHALRQGCFCLDLKGGTKQEIIEEMVDLLVAGGKIAAEHRAPVLKAILDREKKMSTGVQHGVAIPHGKSDVVDELVAAVAIKKEGLDFGSLDGEPSRIFVMTISSVLRTGPHLQFLAEISKLLNVPSVRARILAANTVDELLGVLTSDLLA
ncbi:MAG: PTS sugar transporter subunit IIA [Lentisphaerae bacterium]|nr:PTS sugar transporter subunit IIA [Lentisphaerota bacterium]